MQMRQQAFQYKQSKAITNSVPVWDSVIKINITNFFTQSLLSLDIIPDGFDFFTVQRKFV